MLVVAFAKKMGASNQAPSGVDRREPPSERADWDEWFSTGSQQQQQAGDGASSSSSCFGTPFTLAH